MWLWVGRLFVIVVSLKYTFVSVVDDSDSLCCFLAALAYNSPRRRMTFCHCVSPLLHF